MPNKKLTAIVTTLLFLAGSQGSYAAYNLAQLQTIEQFILSKDCGSLLQYLEDNPSIMEGSDPLARELSAFAQGVTGGLIECLSAQPITGAPDQGLSEDIY